MINVLCFGQAFNTITCHQRVRSRSHTNQNLPITCTLHLITLHSARLFVKVYVHIVEPKTD